MTLMFPNDAPVIVPGPLQPKGESEIVYGDWLTFREYTVENGVTTAHFHINPTTFCAQPPGVVWGMTPYQYWVVITTDGQGNWAFKFVVPGIEYTLSGAFADACGIIYHSNTVEFTPPFPERPNAETDGQ